MQTEAGDDYIRRIATFIRTNERSLAEAGLRRKPRPQSLPAPDAYAYNPLAWFAPSQTAIKPVVLSLDTHHLFYLLMRMEAVGLHVGTLDVRVDSPSRPMSYINLFPDRDKADTLSLSSFRSTFSAVSKLSLGGGWWRQPEPPSLDTELKYIFSAFTKMPALSISTPGPKAITELAQEPPNENAIPLDSFKLIESLECSDIDPRTILGWDRLSDSLRSLKITKSGLEDLSDIFIGAVLDDQARRDGSASRKRRRRIPHGPTRQASFYATNLPDTVLELSEDTPPSPTLAETPSAPLAPLPTSKWGFLKHLFLSDNALTFFPSELFPYLTSVTHLDLSSNLLVSVPPGLGALYNLVSLNLSDNMIDSVLGIYQNLGQVLVLNLAHNRLDTICGLERLHALERVDLRSNHIEETAEIGRLAPLPNIEAVWVEGNPFVEFEENYRVTCFEYFSKEGKSVTLDGTGPGFYEKRNLTVSPPEPTPVSRPISSLHSPPTVAVGHSHVHQHQLHSPTLAGLDQKPSPSTSSNASPHLGPVAAIGVISSKPRRKKVKRIVDLDGNQSDGSSKGAVHRRMTSDGSNGEKRKKPKPVDEPPPAPTILSSGGSLRGPRQSRHSRYQTEYIPADASAVDHIPPLPSFARRQGSQTFSSKAAARRARVSASVYEPPTTPSEIGEDATDEAKAFKRKIEALKKDMGDGWLKVFNQSQLKS